MRLIAIVCLLGGPIALTAAQTYTPPPPPLTTLPPCPVPRDAKEAKKIVRRTDCDSTNRPLPPAAAPSPAATSAHETAAKKFPYPGEEPAKPAETPAAKAFPFPGDAPVAAPATSAAKRFPYPGQSAAVPAPAPDATASAPAPYSSTSRDGEAAADAPASHESSSKTAANDDDDDGQPQLADKGSEGKRNVKTIKSQTDSDRVDEDLSVAKFYGQNGNLMGAYLRAKDAVKTEPDLPEARFVMGEAAKRLRKIDEAKSEFTEYLKLAPDGEHARAAEKALAELP